MGERGEARRAHQPEFLAPFNALARSYRNTALAQMAVLSLPAAVMVQHDSVAAFLFPDSLAVRLGPDEAVHYAIAHAQHRAAGRRQNIHAVAHGGMIADCDVGSLVAVIGAMAAHRIDGARIRLYIGMVNKPAIGSQPAGDGHGKSAAGGKVGAATEGPPSGQNQPHRGQRPANRGLARLAFTSRYMDWKQRSTASREAAAAAA